MINITGVQSPFVIQAGNQPYKYGKSQSSDATPAAAAQDTVSLSPAARAQGRASPAAKNASQAEAGGNLELCAQELADRLCYVVNNLDEVEAEFKSELKAKLRNAGVDCDTPFDLTTARDGKVVVKGEHPDEARIEQFFEDNPDMRNRFVEISSATVIKRHLEQHQEFAEAYERNPRAAVAKYFPIFAMIKREGYTMSIGGEADSSSAAA